MTADIRTAAQREAAWREYRDTVHKHHGAAKRPFLAGYDAGAARVAPTREQIGQILEQHEYDFNIEMCSCGWDQNTAPNSDFERHQADAVLESIAAVSESSDQ